MNKELLGFIFLMLVTAGTLSYVIKDAFQRVLLNSTDVIEDYED